MSHTQWDLKFTLCVLVKYSNMLMGKSKTDGTPQTNDEQQECRYSSIRKKQITVILRNSVWDKIDVR